MCQRMINHAIWQFSLSFVSQKVAEMFADKKFRKLNIYLLFFQVSKQEALAKNH